MAPPATRLLVPLLLPAATCLLVSPPQVGADVRLRHPLTQPRHRRSLLFTDDSLQELILIVVFPIDLANNDLVMSAGVRARYFLPDNATQLLEAGVPVAGRGGRTITRRAVYTTIQEHLHRWGFEGRDCLLRTICEVAESPLRHNGLVGDLLHVLFTPSTSADEGLPREFLEAEVAGRGQTCALAYSACARSPLDFLTDAALH